MKTEQVIEVLKARKSEIVKATLEILPEALSGDSANRTFYYEVNEDGSIKVNYLYYIGQIALDDNCFYTITNYETPDPDEYGYESIGDMDFEGCGFGVGIESAIEQHIALLEEKLATMKTEIEITVEGFRSAIISADSENWYIDLKTGLGEAIYPKSDFTLEEAINDQINWKME